MHFFFLRPTHQDLEVSTYYPFLHQLAVLEVVVVVVVEVVGVVMMSDDKTGSWGWSIINLLSVFCHEKMTDKWTKKPSGRDFS